MASSHQIDSEDLIEQIFRKPKVYGSEDEASVVASLSL
jgi:hypothetical protein